MVEGTTLEMWRTRKGTESSNLSLSDFCFYCCTLSISVCWMVEARDMTLVP